MPIISPLNKYWIDESTLSDLTDYQKALFIQNVDKAAAEWNSVRIADCDGAIIKLERQSSNGLNVVPIRYNPNLDSNVAGQFNPIPLFHEIEIKRYNDYDTIMHEFGHMIGLQDLDLNNSPGTHISLMGYNSDDILHYQDIQGLAVANGKHTEHDFRKYYYYDEMYNYVCFYCDATDPRSTKKYDGEHLEYASSCIHEYENLVSAGSRYWQKCTKCYKVVECEFNIKVLSINSVEIVGLIDNRSSVIVPSTIGGQSIVSIGANAFKNCTNLQEVIISNTVTNIDSSAFENCSYLQSVALPSSLVTIGSSAFKGCASLPSITIPNSVTNIDSSAFE
ncbi:MAG: leucine-rich repeat domain-containing protein, partial [Bacilli bacterium]